MQSGDESPFLLVGDFATIGLKEPSIVPVMDSCEPAKALLEAYTEALAEYRAAQSATLARAVPIDEAAIVRNGVDRARVRLDRARNLYWRHVNTHGCQGRRLLPQTEIPPPHRLTPGHEGDSLWALRGGASALRILIVDDDRGIARLFERILSEDGYLVGVVHSGRDALRAVSDRDYTLAIIDMSLPDMDGADVIQAIRAEWPYIRIVAVSGAMTPAMEVIARRAGACVLQSKPMKPNDLRTAVYRSIDPTNCWLARA